MFIFWVSRFRVSISFFLIKSSMKLITCSMNLFLSLSLISSSLISILSSSKILIVEKGLFVSSIFSCVFPLIFFLPNSCVLFIKELNFILYISSRDSLLESKSIKIIFFSLFSSFKLDNIFSNFSIMLLF